MSSPGRHRGLQRFVLLLCALSLAACSTVDFDAPKTATYADIDTSDTSLGQGAGKIREERHPESGFFTLFAGNDALSARHSAICSGDGCRRY